LNDRRVKVVHVITKLDVGGAQETALALCERLDPASFDVTLLTGPEYGSGGSLLPEARRRGLGVKVIPSLRRQISPVADVRALIALTRILRRQRPSIVHTHSSKAGVLGRMAAVLARTPCVVHTVHGWSFRDYQHPAVRKLYQRLERVMSRVTNRIVVVAATDKAVGLDLGIGRPDQYVLLRSGVELNVGSMGEEMREAVPWSDPPPGAMVIGTVTRLRHPKDNLGFVRMAAILRDRHPEFRFVMVGDGPDRVAIEREIATRHLESQFTLLGVRRDATSLMAAFDVFVLSSLSEGIPRVILEAMAVSVPVVATAVGGVSEVVVHGETGLLVAPGDPMAMADAVELVCHDEVQRDRLTSEAAHRIGEFDVDEMIRGAQSMYEELVGHSGVR
jgi:glycosyltransferase involved in cell wall biosynthesis